MPTTPARELAQSVLSAGHLQCLTDTAPALLHSAQPDGSLDFCNQGWLDFLGASMRDVLGWGWAAWAHPDDLPSFSDKWRACLRTGERFEAESRGRRADGQFRWVWMRNVPLREETGRIIRWYGAGIDIEDRKRAEEALRRNEGYLAEGQSLTHTGSWAYNPSGVFDFFSEETYKMFGFDRTKPLTLAGYLAYVHPEDRAETAALLHKMGAEGCGCDHKYRIVRPGGELRIVRCVGRAVRESGVVTQLVGTSVDITEQERALQEIHALRDQLQRENIALKEEIDQASMFEEIVGSSEPLRRVLTHV